MSTAPDIAARGPAPRAAFGGGFVYVCADPGIPLPGHKGASLHVQSVVREFARRDLQLKQQELEKLSQDDLPKRERELQRGVDKAQRELKEAQEALERQRLESKVAVMQKRDELEVLIEKAAKAKQTAGAETEKEEHE